MKKDTIRTLLIVLGVLVLVAILALGSAVWLFMRSFAHDKADQASATQQFEAIRGRFTGLPPVIEVRNEEAAITRKPPSSAARTRLTTMHIIAWDAEDDELVRIDVPFWLLRLKSGPIEIASDHTWINDDNLGITVEELERYGPTLVLDESRRGGRVIVWTE